MQPVVERISQNDSYMPRKLIVHLTAEFRQTIWGGIATAVDIAGTAMARDGFLVFVISCGPSDFELILEPGLTWIQLDWNRPSLQSLYTAPDRVELGAQISRKMAEKLQNLSSQRDLLVFVHNDEFVDIIDLTVSMSGVEVVVVSHGLVEQEQPERPDLISQQKRLLNLSRAVVIHSEAQEMILSSYYPMSRRHVVPLPLEQLCGETQPHRDSGRVMKRTIVAAGRDVRQKGFDVLAGALRRLRASDPIECSVFSTRRPSCEAVVEMVEGTAHVIRRMGWIPRQRLLREFIRAHAVIVPSRFEPLGLVAAEAMSVEVPVIVSNVGGLGDLVGESFEVGRRVEMDLDGPNERALAEAIDMELSRPPRISSGRRRLSEYSYLRFRQAIEGLPGGLYTQ